MITGNSNSPEMLVVWDILCSESKPWSTKIIFKLYKEMYNRKPRTDEWLTLCSLLLDYLDRPLEEHLIWASWSDLAINHEWRSNRSYCITKSNLSNDCENLKKYAQNALTTSIKQNRVYTLCFSSLLYKNHENNTLAYYSYIADPRGLALMIATTKTIRQDVLAFLVCGQVTNNHESGRAPEHFWDDLYNRLDISYKIHAPIEAKNKEWLSGHPEQLQVNFTILGKIDILLDAINS